MGGGRTPKRPGTRARGDYTPGPVVTPSGARRATIPNLPGAAKMLASTCATWATWWASPMAECWLDADVSAVVRLAALTDEHTRDVRARRSSPAHLLAELRHAEDRLRPQFARSAAASMVGAPGSVGRRGRR